MKKTNDCGNASHFLTYVYFPLVKVREGFGTPDLVLILRTWKGFVLIFYFLFLNVIDGFNEGGFDRMQEAALL